MKKYRKRNVQRALSIAEQIKGIPTEDTQLVSKMLSTLLKPAEAEKIEYIDRTIRQMQTLVSRLRMDDVTTIRMNTLARITEVLFSTLGDQQQKQARDLVKNRLDRGEHGNTSAMVTSGQKQQTRGVVDLNEAAKAYAEMLKNLSAPFWPRGPEPQHRTSLYGQKATDQTRKKAGIRLVTRKTKSSHSSRGKKPRKQLSAIVRSFPKFNELLVGFLCAWQRELVQHLQNNKRQLLSKSTRCSALTCRGSAVTLRTSTATVTLYFLSRYSITVFRYEH